MIEWDDRSNAIAERYVCPLGFVCVTLYREHGAALWWLDASSQMSSERRSYEIAGGLDADAAKVRALELVRPAVDAIAERAAAVARDVAVVLAGARIGGVG